MGTIAFWLVFGCCLASLFLFWAALSAVMGCIFLHDHDEEVREFFADRELTKASNEELLVAYYTAKGWNQTEISDLLWELDLTYPMSNADLVEYAARREDNRHIRSNNYV